MSDLHDLFMQVPPRPNWTPDWASAVLVLLLAQKRNYNKTSFTLGAVKFQCRDVPDDKIPNALEILVGVGRLRKGDGPKPGTFIWTLPDAETETISAPSEE